MQDQDTAAPDTVTVRLRRARVTAGTYMFQELDDNGREIHDLRSGKIGNMYVRKSTFQGMEPHEIEVTVRVIK